MDKNGFITWVGAVQTGTSSNGNNWQSRDFVIEHGSLDYPRKMVLSLRGESVNRFDDVLHVGKRVKVSFEIDAQEHNGRWFNRINAWNVQEVLPEE